MTLMLRLKDSERLVIVIGCKGNNFRYRIIKRDERKRVEKIAEEKALILALFNKKNYSSLACYSSTYDDGNDSSADE